MSELLSSGTSSRAHLAAGRGDRGNSRQTGWTVPGEGWEAERSRLGQGEALRGGSALETCPSSPELPKSAERPTEVSPKPSPAS